MDLAGAFHQPMRGDAFFYYEGPTPTFTLHLKEGTERGLVLSFWPLRQTPPAPGRYPIADTCGALENWCKDGAFVVSEYGFGGFGRINSGEVILIEVDLERVEGTLDFTGFTATNAQHTDAHSYTGSGEFKAVRLLEQAR